MTGKEITFVLNCYRDMAGKPLNEVMCVPSEDMIAIADLCNQQKYELASLKCDLDAAQGELEFMKIREETIKAEAVKEFAKKIEDTTWYSINSEGELVVGANGESDVPLYKAEDILKIAEKMVGENDAKD